MATYIFKETQRFSKLWIWVLLAFSAGIVLLSVFNPIESNINDIWIPLGIIGFVFLLFLSLSLKTRIDSTSLSFSYFPFIGERKYSFQDIVAMELKEYNSLWEYGGWGIRYNFEYWVYNTGGRFGIIVKTKDKKFLIGTHKPEEAKKALAMFEEYKSQNHGS
jgi:hypothetical protein